MSGGPIDSQSELQAIFGKTPPAIALKVIDHLDEGACRWIALSPMLFAGFGSEEGLAITMAGSEPGFATGTREELAIPRDLLDDPDLPRPGQSFGSLLLVPGIGETLRINGRVLAVEDAVVRIGVSECYVHCAKALIRSEFWAAGLSPAAFDEPAALVPESRFMALATMDANGGLDVSPKGDPAGKLVCMDKGQLLFAERPGNRRVDGFRNILSRPQVAATLIVPGTDTVLKVTGTASLSTDEAARELFAVQDKTPLLVTRVATSELQIRRSRALSAAGLWRGLPPARAPISPAQLLRDHMKINARRGIGAKVTSAIVSIPGLMEKGLEKDYQTNLY